MSVSKSLQKARSLSRNGEFASAISLYREVLDRFPQNREAKRELRVLSAAPPPKSSQATAAISEFRDLNSKGEFKAVASIAKGVLQRLPNEAELHNLTGIALANLGQHQAAASRYQSALKLHPGYASAFYNLGMTLLQVGQPDDALKTFSEAHGLGLDDADLHGNLGRSQTGTGDHEAAVISYRRALDLGGNRVALLNNLGSALLELSRNDEAEDCYLEALNVDPAFVKTHSHLCELYEKQVRLDDLSESVDRAKAACRPDHPEIMFREAQLASHEGKPKRARLVLDNILATELPTSLVAPFYELSGKTDDRLGRYSQAFAMFRRMNEHVLDTQPHAQQLANGFSEKLGLLRDSWKSESGARSSESLEPNPQRHRAFLIGFPRSGTTLLDTLLRGHPDIEVIEEKPLVGAMAKALGSAQTPDTLDALSREQILEMRAIYDKELSRYLPDASGAKIIVDKLPLNICNAALIHRVFPDSLFILSLRHPCDCVLSCFMQNFRLNGAMANCLTIEGAARLYRDVFDLWQSIRTNLDPTVVEVRYDDLVRDVERTCRPVIEALGADWNDNLLNHQETAEKRGGVRTPSYSQVSQPIYSRAEGRWRKYQSELEPVLPILEPWVEALGYDLRISSA